MIQPPSKKLSAKFSSPSYLSSASVHTSSGNPISINFLTLAFISISYAYYSTHCFAVWLYNSLSVLYYLATSASWGSSGSGAHSNAYSEISPVRIVNAGVHSFLRISKQIAPVCELIFGCHILVSNFIFGGLKG